MPHLHGLIDQDLLNSEPLTPSARQFAINAGYDGIRLMVEAKLKKPDQVAFFAHSVSSIEPHQNRLDVEFVLDTGIYYPTRPDALVVALRIFERINDGSERWRLPEKWGFWFKCKGDFDDIFISPDTYLAWRDYLARLGASS